MNRVHAILYFRDDPICYRFVTFKMRIKVVCAAAYRSTECTGALWIVTLLSAMIKLLALGTSSTKHLLCHCCCEYLILRAINHYQWKQNTDERVVLERKLA